MRAHRGRELQEYVDRVRRRLGRAEAEQMSQKLRAVGQGGAALVNELHRVAFEHDDVYELARLAPTSVLDDEQTGRYDFEHEADARHVARRAPYAEARAVAPDAEVYAGAFDRWREARERDGVERETLLEAERAARLLGLKEGERNL